MLCTSAGSLLVCISDSIFCWRITLTTGFFVDVCMNSEFVFVRIYNPIATWQKAHPRVRPALFIN